MELVLTKWFIEILKNLESDINFRIILEKL